MKLLFLNILHWLHEQFSSCSNIRSCDKNWNSTPIFQGGCDRCSFSFKDLYVCSVGRSNEH